MSQRQCTQLQESLQSPLTKKVGQGILKHVVSPTFGFMGDGDKSTDDELGSVLSTTSTDMEMSSQGGVGTDSSSMTASGLQSPQYSTSSQVLLTSTVWEKNPSAVTVIM